MALAFKACPQIGYEYLRPLVEAYRLALEPRFITKAWEMAFKQVYESGGRSIGFLDAGQE